MSTQLSGADLSAIALPVSSGIIVFFSALYPSRSGQELLSSIPNLAGRAFLLSPCTKKEMLRAQGFLVVKSFINSAENTR